MSTFLLRWFIYRDCPPAYFTIDIQTVLTSQWNSRHPQQRVHCRSQWSHYRRPHTAQNKKSWHHPESSSCPSCHQSCCFWAPSAMAIHTATKGDWKINTPPCNGLRWLGRITKRHLSWGKHSIDIDHRTVNETTHRIWHLLLNVSFYSLQKCE